MNGGGYHNSPEHVVGCGVPVDPCSPANSGTSPDENIAILGAHQSVLLIHAAEGIAFLQTPARLALAHSLLLTPGRVIHGLKMTLCCVSVHSMRSGLNHGSLRFLCSCPWTL